MYGLIKIYRGVLFNMLLMPHHILDKCTRGHRDTVQNKKRAGFTGKKPPDSLQGKFWINVSVDNMKPYSQYWVVFHMAYFLLVLNYLKWRNMLLYIFSTVIILQWAVMLSSPFKPLAEMKAHSHVTAIYMFIRQIYHIFHTWTTTESEITYKG